jgi:3-hydroxyanthranilate 3,4-dioxygenase
VEWYCFDCKTRVHRAEVDLESIVDDLPPIYAAFYADAKLRTCPNCGTVHPGKEPPAGWVTV